MQESKLTLCENDVVGLDEVVERVLLEHLNVGGAGDSCGREQPEGELLNVVHVYSWTEGQSRVFAGRSNWRVLCKELCLDGDVQMLQETGGLGRGGGTVGNLLSSTEKTRAMI
jgi:hypothetical protein